MTQTSPCMSGRLKFGCKQQTTCSLQFFQKPDELYAPVWTSMPRGNCIEYHKILRTKTNQPHIIPMVRFLHFRALHNGPWSAYLLISFPIISLHYRNDRLHKAIREREGNTIRTAAACSSGLNFLNGLNATLMPRPVLQVIPSSSAFWAIEASHTDSFWYADTKQRHATTLEPCWTKLLEACSQLKWCGNLNASCLVPWCAHFSKARSWIPAFWASELVAIDISSGLKNKCHRVTNSIKWKHIVTRREHLRGEAMDKLRQSHALIRFNLLRLMITASNNAAPRHSRTQVGKGLDRRWWALEWARQGWWKSVKVSESHERIRKGPASFISQSLVSTWRLSLDDLSLLFILSMLWNMGSCSKTV